MKTFRSRNANCWNDGRFASGKWGVSIGRPGMLDEQIISLLQWLRRSTFFSRDNDFYERNLCHSGYCLVYLSVEKSESAWFVRRLFRQTRFNTHAKRMGMVIRVSHAAVYFWQRHRPGEQHVPWQ